MLDRTSSISHLWGAAYGSLFPLLFNRLDVQTAKHLLPALQSLIALDLGGRTYLHPLM